MIVPVIAVEGDIWTLWVAYWQDKGVAFSGPTPMGNTSSDLGVFQILSTLRVIAQWGITEYKRWFNEEVMKKHRDDIGV